MSDPHRDVVTIETPEHVLFEYELAGLGSRLVAAMLDLLFIGLTLGALLAIFFLAAGGLSLGGAGADSALWMVALGVLAAFVTLWGYPILFELFMRGQTPGKRIVGLRVIREGGYALTPAAVVVRNLMRLADWLPGAYFLGILVMILHPRYKRIGDIVAGTIVIRERRHAPAPARPAVGPRLAAALAPLAADLRQAGVHRLPAGRVRVIEDFLGRRQELSAPARAKLSRELAAFVSTELGIATQDPMAFLQAVVAAWHESDRRSAGEAPPPEPPA